MVILASIFSFYYQYKTPLTIFPKVRIIWKIKTVSSFSLGLLFVKIAIFKGRKSQKLDHNHSLIAKT